MPTIRYRGGGAEARKLKEALNKQVIGVLHPSGSFFEHFISELFRFSLLKHGVNLGAQNSVSDHLN